MAAIKVYFRFGILFYNLVNKCLVIDEKGIYICDARQIRGDLSYTEINIF